MYLIRASQQIGMTGEDGKNMSQKHFKLKTNPDNATYKILKYDATSNIIILYVTQRPALCFRSSIFMYHFNCFFLQ